MLRHSHSYTKFLVIWAGQLLSRLGSGMSAFVLGVHLFQKHGSVSSYSLLLLCAFLPSVLLAPIGGVIADRYNRKWMMILGDIGSALGILFALILFASRPDWVWPLYIGVAISSVFVALHSPAFKASVTDLLDEKDYAKASGLIQLAEASRYLFAPVIAGFLMMHLGITIVLWLDALTFIAAASAVMMVRRGELSATRPGGSATSALAQLGEGLRAVFSSRLVFRLLCLTTAVMFLTGALQALFAPLVLGMSDAATFGTVQSVAAAGMLFSSLLIGLRGKTDGHWRMLRYGLAGAGVCYSFIGLSSTATLVTVAAFGFFFCLPFVNTSLEVLFRTNIHNDLQGRAWSMISLVSQSGMLVAFVLAGVAADHIFNPLLSDGGAWATGIGQWFGTGPSRGSGLLLVIMGGSLTALAGAITYQHNVIRVAAQFILSFLDLVRANRPRSILDDYPWHGGII